MVTTKQSFGRKRFLGYLVLWNCTKFIYNPIGWRVGTIRDDKTNFHLYHDEDIIADYSNAISNIATYIINPRLIDTKYVMKIGNSNYYFHRDAINSTRRVTDEEGFINIEYNYSAYGSHREVIEGIANRYRFTGREFDLRKQLYYYRMRHYDSRTGSFLSRDPIFGNPLDILTMNRYTYAVNNPGTLTDQFGLCPPAQQGWILVSEAEVFEDEYSCDSVWNTVKCEWQRDCYFRWRSCIRIDCTSERIGGPPELRDSYMDSCAC